KLKTFNDKDLPTVLYLIGKAQATMAAKRADTKAARDLRIEAGLNLMRVVALFPDGERVPDALFEAGQISEGLGNKVAARAAYREVMRRYGKTPAAGQAKVALESLDRAGE
ncbi:MAG: tetratricopeptide repeat protein, partial [Planctomycetota bacterium]